MSKCHYGFLFLDYFITIRTVCSFCQTALLTGCLYRLVGYDRMTFRRDYFLLCDHFLTYGTMFSLCQTALCTGCLHCRIRYDLVTFCRNLLLPGNNFLTYGAMLSFCQTTFRTSRFYCLVCYDLVTQWCYPYPSLRDRIADGAENSVCPSVFCTGCRCPFFLLKHMAFFPYFLLLHKNLIADRTVFSFCQAFLTAGCLYRLVRYGMVFFRC